MSIVLVGGDTLAPLVEANGLTAFPGAPFSEDLVAAACADIRDECGWHIAPLITQVYRTEPVGRFVFLPTMALVNVLSVRDDENALIEVADFHPRTGRVELKRHCVRGMVTVTFQHGFDDCPPGLLPAIAERVQRAKAGSVRQESLGSRSVTLAASAEQSSVDAVSRFRLAARP